MTDRLEDIKARMSQAPDPDPAAQLWNDAQDKAWLIAELRKTRRLGNQLADALAVAYEELDPDHHSPALAAWREHLTLAERTARTTDPPRPQPSSPPSPHPDADAGS